MGGAFLLLLAMGGAMQPGPDGEGGCVPSCTAQTCHDPACMGCGASLCAIPWIEGISGGRQLSKGGCASWCNVYTCVA